MGQKRGGRDSSEIGRLLRTEALKRLLWFEDLKEREKQNADDTEPTPRIEAEAEPEG